MQLRGEYAAWGDTRIEATSLSNMEQHLSGNDPVRKAAGQLDSYLP